MCQTFVQGYDTFPAIEQENLIYSMEFWVRKGAHCFEYMALGILMHLNMAIYAGRGRGAGNRAAMDFWGSGQRRPAIIFLASLAAGILYAVGDELHQYFVPGRSCELRDVIIDSFGVFIGAVAVLIVTFRRKKKVE